MRVRSYYGGLLVRRPPASYRAARSYKSARLTLDLVDGVTSAMSAGVWFGARGRVCGARVVFRARNGAEMGRNARIGCIGSYRRGPIRVLANRHEG
jgi:hypothetical protein